MKGLKRLFAGSVIIFGLCFQSVPVYATEPENVAVVQETLLQEQLEKAKELCIIQDVHGVLTEEEKQHLKNHFAHLLLYLWPEYGREELEMPIVTFVIDSGELPAGTGGITTETGKKGRIIMPEDSFRDSQRVKELVTHELMHVLQDYGDTGMFWWMTESISDYVTHIQIWTDDTALQGYSGGDLFDGYETGARFLQWLENKKAPGIVRKMNRILQEGTFRTETFQELTGQNLSDLWLEYSGQELPTMQSYLDAQTGILGVKNRAAYYFYGYEGAPDYAKALQSYQIADQMSVLELGKGDTYCLFMIGDIYRDGKLGQPDYQNAALYYQKIFAMGENSSIDACYRLGDLYYDHGTELGDHDDQMAAEWYTKAAEAETTASPYASMKLGCVFEKRNDTQPALFWFQRAIQQEEKLGVHTDFTDYSQYMIERLLTK